MALDALVAEMLAPAPTIPKRCLDPAASEGLAELAVAVVYLLVPSGCSVVPGVRAQRHSAATAAATAPRTSH
jgi:hypothetical protein